MKKKRNKKFSKRSKILKKNSKIKKRNKLRETKKRNLKRKKRRLRKINRIASRIKLEKIKLPKFNKQIKQFKKISFIKMVKFTSKVFDKAIMKTTDFIVKPLKSFADYKQKINELTVNSDFTDGERRIKLVDVDKEGNRKSEDEFRKKGDGWWNQPHDMMDNLSKKRRKF